LSDAALAGIRRRNRRGALRPGLDVRLCAALSRCCTHGACRVRVSVPGKMEVTQCHHLPRIKTFRGARQNGKLHSVTICRELGHSHQIITSEHGGTDRRRKWRHPGCVVAGLRRCCRAREHPRPVQHTPGVNYGALKPCPASRTKTLSDPAFAASLTAPGAPPNASRPVQLGGGGRNADAVFICASKRSRKVTPCHYLPRTKTYRSTH
jgi:hypothetical protein